MNYIIIFLSLATIFWLNLQKDRWKKKYEEKEVDYKKLFGQKKSSEVRTGQIAEQLAPFLDNFGHDPKKAHFLGQPIDYIIFNEDMIIFKEIKSGGSQLTTVQKNIKRLVEDKKVAWEETRINGNKVLETSEVHGAKETAV